MRILVAKPGLDGHDRGARVMVHILRDAGYEVIYSGLHATVDSIVRAAIDEDVDVIGLSVLTGGYETIASDVLARLKAEGAAIAVVVGGVVRKPDIPRLLEMGVAQVFPTGSRFDDILIWFRERDAARSAT